MFVIVYTATGTKKEAEIMAKKLVAERLAACVNYFPISSAYRWKGRLEYSKEYLIACKTTRKKLPSIKRRINSLHTYELPEIIAIPIIGGSKEYLSWIQMVVAPT